MFHFTFLLRSSIRERETGPVRYQLRTRSMYIYIHSEDETR